MTINLADGRVPFDVVKDLGLGRPYRLWCKTITAGRPIVILVHGAVVPLFIPDELYDPNNINNEKYCSFYQLDSLLYYDNDFHYNVFTFEYTDMPILDQGSVNYHALTPYGNCLIDAIKIAKRRMAQEGTVGPVTVIAHSMGGLIARYAVQALGVEEVDKIITLDTGHRGFGLAAIVDELFIDPFPGLIPPPTLCSVDAAPNSDFLNALNSGFAKCPELVSLAALDPIPVSFFAPEMPPIPITVVDSQSSNMGQEVYPLHYNHVSIAQITGSDHGAYKIIKEILG